MSGVRRVLAIAAALAALAAATACGGAGGVTRIRVEKAVVPTFSNLFVIEQAQHGRRVSAGALKTKAVCTRGDRSAADNGPGDDWSCNLAWIQNAAGVPGAAAYTLHVKPDGCYTADGDGPADLNGSPTLTRLDGASVVNPLWAFDGCFDVSG
ncbi:MAG: hypothetical protein ACR2F6_10460 [Mycobacteriales bacterium]